MRPNIIYINSHDTGRYIQPYGHAVETPNLQKLAERGVLFRKMFCAGPTCSPSRAALTTGQAPHNSGMLGLAHRGFGLYDQTQHMLHTLAQAGYSTTLIGGQHLFRNPSTGGYDQVLATGAERLKIVPTATEFLQKQSQQQSAGKPFYLEIGFFETHRVYPPADLASDARYTLPPAPIPDTPQTRADMAGFKTSARWLDEQMGAILGALDACGLGDNTLVICTTDHGIAFPGMKCNLTDHGIGVMLMMRGPGGFSGGKVVDGMLSQIDIFPTLCDLLQIDPPAHLQGKSFMPLINGSTKEVNEEVFAEVTFHAAYEPQRAVRTNRWKYIRRFEDRGHPILPNCDDSVSKTLWMEAGWNSRRPAIEQLYDLAFDPNEANNLAGDAGHAAVLQDMQGRLDRWMKRTNDPLLDPNYQAPSGAVVNDPDGVSPNDATRRVVK